MEHHRIEDRCFLPSLFLAFIHIPVPVEAVAAGMDAQISVDCWYRCRVLQSESCRYVRMW